MCKSFLRKYKTVQRDLLGDVSDTVSFLPDSLRRRVLIRLTALSGVIVFVSEREVIAMARLPALRRLLSVAAVAALLSLGTASPAPTSCNGSPALCGRRYSEVSFVGSHDSPFVGVEIGTNQFESVTKQLDLGVRFLQSQAHMYKGALKMCHTSCLLKDSGTVQKYLEDVKRWMDAHPNEVVTLLITNPRGAKVQDFANAFAAAKMDGMAFVPREKTLKLDQWPTLGELISSGKRLVVFLGTIPHLMLQLAPISLIAHQAHAVLLDNMRANSQQTMGPTRRPCPGFLTSGTTTLRRRSV